MKMDELKGIYEEKVTPVLQEYLTMFSDDYDKNREKWKKQWIALLENQVIQALEERQMQMSYLHFHLLRTRLLCGDYRYAVNCYDEDWYLKEPVKLADWDVSFVYQYFQKFRERLDREYKQLDIRLCEVDVECFLMWSVKEFHAYIVKLLRYSRLSLFQSEFYRRNQVMEERGIFHLLSGEYFDFCEFIYKETMNTDRKELVEQILDRRQEDTYNFNDFRGICLENGTLEQYEFQYSNFTGAHFRNVIFLECDLKGAVFREATFENVRFERCNLTEAIFMDGDFEDVDFIGSYLEDSWFGKEQVEALLMDHSLWKRQTVGMNMEGKR